MKSVRINWGNLVGFASMFLLSLMLVIITVNDTSSPVEAAVYKKDAAVDTLHRFADASIIGVGKIHVAQPSSLLHFLAPRNMLDFPYALLLLLASVVLIVFFLDFSYRNPFSRKALWGLRLLCGLLLVFWVANFWRHEWLDEQVRLLTGGQYAYDRPATSPEFWIFFVLLRLLWIFKSGYALQKEQDLTV